MRRTWPTPYVGAGAAGCAHSSALSAASVWLPARPLLPSSPALLAQHRAQPCPHGVPPSLPQMFERETKREKILEARHREMRLKERARSEGQDAETEEIPEESPQEALDRAQKEFFEVIEAELQRRARAEARHLDGKVPAAARTRSCRGLRNPRGSPPPAARCHGTGSGGAGQGTWGSLCLSG